MSAAPPLAAPLPPLAPPARRRAEWALLYGNFAIGCGVMVTAGSLNDITRSLQVSAAVAGQLIAVAAVVMGLGAPLLAAAVGNLDRRRLLAATLLWYGIGHAACALAPGYGTLMLLRSVTVLGAAAFTPQAASTITRLVPPERQGRAITFIFLGWSLASVIGMPVHSFIGETFGWRWAFALVALLSAPAAWWVWRSVPDGVRPPALSLASWRAVATSPVLVAIVLVTAASGAGQFTLFTYFAPYFRQEIGVSAVQISVLFAVFGVFGVLGNVLVARRIDALGPARCVAWSLLGIALSILAWRLGTGPVSMALVLVPWALGCFAGNSAQQARLSQAAPALAPALIALNTSAIYAGQAVGAAGGGVMVAAGGWGYLQPVGLAWLALAMGLSAWAARRTPPPRHA